MILKLHGSYVLSLGLYFYLQFPLAWLWPCFWRSALVATQSTRSPGLRLRREPQPLTHRAPLEPTEGFAAPSVCGNLGFAPGGCQALTGFVLPLGLSTPATKPPPSLSSAPCLWLMLQDKWATERQMPCAFTHETSTKQTSKTETDLQTQRAK